MKLSLLKKGASPAAMLAAASIAYLGMSQQAEAGVIWLASDTPGGLVLATDGGSIDILSSSSIGPSSPADAFAGSSFMFTHRTSSRVFSSAGTLAGSSPWIAATGRTSSQNISTFGHNGSLIFASNTTHGTVTPDSTMTFAGLDIATAFGTNLDLGPVLLWTANAGGTNTISVARAVPLAAVPEPSSTALLGLGTFGILLRRRRS